MQGTVTPKRVFGFLEGSLTAVVKRLRHEHLWAALGLISIGLAHFLLVDFGNQYGSDEWIHLYTANEALFQSGDGRPLHLFALGVAIRLLGVHQTTTYRAYLVLRIGVAFILYLLVRHFSPDKPVFAFACATLYLTYLLRDDHIIRSWYMVTFCAFVLYTVLALYLYFTSMSTYRPVRLMLSLVCAAMAGAAYEGVFPVLVGIPVMMFVIERDFSRYRLIGMAAWLGVLALSSLRIVLPILGLTRTTYTSRLEYTLDPVTLLARSAQQFKWGFLDPLIFDRPSVMLFRLHATITVSIVLVVLTVMRRKLKSPSGVVGVAPARSYAYWLAAGIGATWLGFSAILPTAFGQYLEHVHDLSNLAEAIAICAAIWLASHLLKSANYRWLVRYVAVAYVVAFGTAQAGRLQDYLAGQGGKWENQAYFLRSLAHIAPSVKEGTMFIYVHQSDDLAPPIYTSHGFEYAIRYLYDDEADGMWLKYHRLVGRTWEASDEGITVTSSPEIQGRMWALDNVYGWDEVIVVGRDASGRAVVMDELPPELATEERASLYDPYSRILEHTFVSPRTQELLPPVQAH